MLFENSIPALTAIHETYLRMSSSEITVSLAKAADLLQAKVFVESQLPIVENGIERLDISLDALRSFVDKDGEKVLYLSLFVSKLGH